jgi:hypothetical protein
MSNPLPSLATPFNDSSGDDDGDKYSRIMAMLITILERQDTMIEAQAKNEADLESHMAREEEAIGKWMDSLPVTPEGKPDIGGHRLFHQELIEEARERKKMWRDLRSEILKKSTWAIVGVIGALVAYWWTNEIRK